MHELSIISSLLELCEEEALRNKAKTVKEIQVKIGRLSGVELDLFQRSFDTFKESSHFCKEAKLKIELSDLKILCLSCKQESVLQENIFTCPECKARDFKILEGEELHLMRLIME